MQTADRTERKWKPLVMRKSKARAMERVFISNGCRRVGYFVDLAAAEAECAKRNAEERQS